MIATGLRHFALATAALLTAMPVTHAADVSAWDADARSGMRLIAGKGTGDANNRVLRAGVELKLAPGWKTYWRYPGDSGVPPRFDFSQSSNVKSVDVQWPLPHRFADGSGHSIGYRDAVIFPLSVVPEDKSKPVTLRLKLDYAICEKLCVPVDAKAELGLSDGVSSQDTALTAAAARVPKPAALNEGTALAINSVRRESAGKLPKIVVDVTAPENSTVDLFAEGPSPDWSLPLPAPVPGAPAGKRRFAFELDGLPPGATATGATLTLTAVAGANAIEVTAHLD